MRKLLSLCIGMISIGLQAADTVFVKTPQVPILIERHDNVLAYMRLDAKETQTLENVTLTFDKEVPLSQIKAVKLYYSGTDASQDRGKKRFAPVEYISSQTPGQTLSANPSYSIKKSEVTPKKHTLTLEGKQNLFPGYNFFWVSIEMQPTASLQTKISAEITQVKADQKCRGTKGGAENGSRRTSCR